MRFAAIRLLIATTLLVGVAVGTTAHPAAAADPVLTAKLVDFRPWIGPNNDLTATIQLTNNGSSPLPLSGLQIHVDVFPGPGNRSDLENQFEGHTGTPQWTDTQYLSLPDLAPGESRAVQFDHQAPLSSITFFKTGADDRAYPIRFTVGAGGFTAQPLTTSLLYFTEAQGVDHPLGVALVIPLDAPTAFDPGGKQEVSQDLEEAIAAGGRIDRILTSLEDPRHAEVAVTLAPTGKFLDSLAFLASPTGFLRATHSGTTQVLPNDPAVRDAAATLQRLKTLAQRPGIRLIASPYSGALLPALTSNGLSNDVNAQIEAGRNEIKTVLGFDPMSGWLLPRDGLLDESTLSQATGVAVSNVVVSASSLVSVTPPNLTPGAQVMLKGPVASPRNRAQESFNVGGVVADQVLTSRLDDGSVPSALQVRQRFLAESATILLEQPAHARNVAVLAPADWNPDPVVIDGILDAIAPGTGSPWMTGVTPDLVLSQATDTPVRNVAASVSDALPQAPAPARDYFDALRAARTALDDFSTIGPPVAMIDQLARNVLIAEGAEWWGKGGSADRGRGFARSVVDAVKTEFAKIQAPKDQLIVLTNRHATIPLALTSRTTYKVRVKVGLESDKLAFQNGVPCRIPTLPAQTTCLSVDLKPGAQTVQVKATANFTGSFRVKVDLLTDTSAGAKISTGRLSIRSTAYNIVALALMGAAGAFILLSWARSVAKRRIALQGSLAGPPVD